MVHMVFTLALQMQPSVVYIDEIDSVFAASSGKKKKSAAAAAGGGPTLLKKDFLAHAEALTVKDRVLIIGNAREPYDDSVDRDAIMEFFSKRGHGKAVFLPYPDYATRYKLWSHFITAKGLDLTVLSQQDCFDLGPLSHVSNGYTTGAIQTAVSTTLTARRVQLIQEGRRPLDTSEFLTALSKATCVYDDQHRALQLFTEEISGEKARKAAIAKAAAGDAEEGDGKKKEKKKDGKKKKKK
jgi:SpoVK/Ycf46/Vps4 family AAA+-type ATPase